MNALRKVRYLPAWKHWLFVLCVFVLGVLIGRLLIDRWQLVAGIGAVLVGMTLLLATGQGRKR